MRFQRRVGPRLHVRASLAILCPLVLVGSIAGPSLADPLTLSIEGDVTWSTFEETGDCEPQCDPPAWDFVAPGSFSATVVIDPIWIGPALTQPADGDRWTIDAVAPTTGNTWMMPAEPLYLSYPFSVPVARPRGLFSNYFHAFEQRFEPAGASAILEARIWMDLQIGVGVSTQETLFLHSAAHPANSLSPGQFVLSNAMLQSLHDLEFTFERHSVYIVPDYEVHRIVRVGGEVTSVVLAPEPATGGLFLSGLCVLVALRRRRTRSPV